MLTYRQTVILSALIGLEIGIAFWVGYAFGYIEGDLIEKRDYLDSPNPNGPDGPGGEEVHPARSAAKETGGDPEQTAALHPEAIYN